MKSIETTDRVTKSFIVAWCCALAFYFFEYVGRSAPAVMMPELSKAFGVSPIIVSSILGAYYYTYAITSLIAGVLLDKLGPQYVVPGGMAILGVGCLVFSIPQAQMGDVGRLLQGTGSAFAFTGAVYLAAHGFPAKRLATAIGITQCLGMLGGTFGQVVVGHLIHGTITVPYFWSSLGAAVLAVGVALVILTPSGHESHSSAKLGLLSTYKIVFTNPQSYLCGAVSGLLFVPTTIGDMVWGVRLFQEDRMFAYPAAVFAASMVPLGWVFGCPLLGWASDKLGRRKPALFAGILVMVACLLQLTYYSTLTPAGVSLFILGVASGAAMIPYTIIQEVNPEYVKGTATGVINFLTFGVTALIGPIFAGLYGKTLGDIVSDPILHYHHAGLFWIAVVAVAFIVMLGLKEPGLGRQHYIEDE